MIDFAEFLVENGYLTIDEENLLLEMNWVGGTGGRTWYRAPFDPKEHGWTDRQMELLQMACAKGVVGRKGRELDVATALKYGTRLFKNEAMKTKGATAFYTYTSDKKEQKCKKMEYKFAVIEKGRRKGQLDWQDPKVEELNSTQEYEDALQAWKLIKAVDSGKAANHVQRAHAKNANGVKGSFIDDPILFKEVPKAVQSMILKQHEESAKRHQSFGKYIKMFLTTHTGLDESPERTKLEYLKTVTAYIDCFKRNNKHGIGKSNYESIVKVLKTGFNCDLPDSYKTGKSTGDLYNFCKDTIDNMKSAIETRFEVETARKTEEERINKTKRMIKLAMGGKLHYEDQLGLEDKPFMSAYKKYFDEVKQCSKYGLPPDDKFIMRESGLGVTQETELSEAYRNMNLVAKFLKELNKINDAESMTDFQMKFEKSGIMLQRNFLSKSLEDKKKEMQDKLTCYYSEMLKKAWTVHRRNSSVYKVTKTSSGEIKYKSLASPKVHHSKNPWEITDDRWASDSATDLRAFLWAVRDDITPTGPNKAISCEVFGPGQMENMIRMFISASRKLMNMGEKACKELRMESLDGLLNTTINGVLSKVYGTNITLDDFEDIPLTNNSELLDNIKLKKKNS